MIYNSNPSTDLADVAPGALLTCRRDNQAVAARPVCYS